MHSIHHADLKTLLETLRPASLLLIDPHPLPHELLTASRDRRSIQLTQDILANLEGLGRFDFAIVAHTLEYLDRKTAGRILARLRDVQVRHFVALVPVGDTWEGHRSRWEATDLLGYGMTLLARYREDGKPLHLYHYAIETYKTTPEWFNSRHWAHPERWKP